MKLFVCIYDDARLLPHFLRHYARFGISEFHIAVPKHLANYVDVASKDYNVRQYGDLDVADSFVGGVSAITDMRMLSQEANEWIVIVDLDEFAEFSEPLQHIIAKMEVEGANVARGIMYDRFSADGQPKSFEDSSDLPSLYPVKARLTKNIMKGEDIKGVVIKGHLESRGAHHIFHHEKVFSTMFEISHYKWNDRSLARVRLAYEVLSTSGVHWAIQYRRILEHYESNGRFAWETFGGAIVERS